MSSSKCSSPRVAEAVVPQLTGEIVVENPGRAGPFCGAKWLVSLAPGGSLLVSVALAFCLRIVCR